MDPENHWVVDENSLTGVHGGPFSKVHVSLQVVSV